MPGTSLFLKRFYMTQTTAKPKLHKPQRILNCSHLEAENPVLNISHDYLKNSKLGSVRPRMEIKLF